MNPSTDDGKTIATTARYSEIPSIFTMTGNQPTPSLHFDDLPVELLIRIIYFAIDTHGGTNKDIFFPYTALLVSKRWHDVALSAPELWTAVSLDCASTSDQLSTLERHSTRSRNRPLHLDINMENPKTPIIWLQVLHPQSAGDKKWKNLRIRGLGGYVLLMVTGAARRIHEDAQCLASLETLVIVEQNRSMMVNGYRGVPGVGRILPKLLRDLTTLTCLHTHHVSLDHVARWPTPTETLSVTSSLRELVIEGVDVEAVLLFGWVDFPMLRTLGIQCLRYERTTAVIDQRLIPADIKLPALKRVVLYEVDPASACTILASSPEIHLLALSHTSSTQALQSLSDGGLCPKLTNLLVEGTMEPWLSEVVKERLPMLERLSLDAGVAEDTGVGGSSAMSWLRAHVEVELLEAGELEFSQICRRLSSTVLEWA